jgi:hypothetical protein
MPIGLRAGLVVNDLKSNDLGLFLYCSTAELESTIVHFL